MTLHLKRRGLEFEIYIYLFIIYLFILQNKYSQ